MRFKSQSSAVSGKSGANKSSLLEELDPKKIPAHVAIIMDGNGRWAKKRHMPRVFGHRAGVASVREIVQVAGEVGVRFLTLYAFSSENWSRPAAEVNALMKLLEEFLAKELPELHRSRVRLQAIGRWKDLPAGARSTLESVIHATRANDGLVLNLALNYGGRQEIIDACNEAWASGERRLDEKVLRRFMYAPDCPDPDLLIRTSGEVRLSNFLLWQSAYTELHVTDVLWPEFRRHDFLLALLDFQKRERRFGGL